MLRLRPYLDHIALRRRRAGSGSSITRCTLLRANDEMGGFADRWISDRITIFVINQRICWFTKARNHRLPTRAIAEAACVHTRITASAS